jgi:hypothetical protein
MKSALSPGESLFPDLRVMTHQALNRLLLTFALVGTLGAGEAVAQQCSTPYGAITRRTDPVRQASNYEAATEAFKLTNLSAVALPDGWRELRLWLFPGILTGKFHIRIVEHADSVCGEVRQFWSAGRNRAPFTRVSKFNHNAHDERLVGDILRF